MAVPVGLQLIFVAVLASFLGEASALDCFQCNSHNDSRCLQNPPPLELRQPCSHGQASMCRKITQTVEFEMNGLVPDMRVIRSCGWDESSHVGRCYQRSGFGGRQEVCSCLGDNCNSAALPAAATALVLGSIAMLRVW